MRHLRYGSIILIFLHSPVFPHDGSDLFQTPNPILVARPVASSGGAMAQKHILCEAKTGCDFTHATLYTDTFTNEAEKSFLNEMEDRYPGISKILSDPHRTQIAQVDGSIFLPPAANGYISVKNAQGFNKAVQETLDRIYATLEQYKVDSAKAGGYGSSVKGFLRDRGMEGADEIAKDGDRDRALRLLGFLKKDLGVTNPQVLNQVYGDIHSADARDLENLKQNRSLLTKVMAVTPVVALAAPVAMWVAGGATVAAAGTGMLTGTGLVLPTAGTAGVLSLAGAGLAGAADLVLQAAQKFDGLREHMDGRRTAAAVATGAVAGPLLAAAPQAGVALGASGFVAQGYDGFRNAGQGHYATAAVNALNAGLSAAGVFASAKRNAALANTAQVSQTNQSDPVSQAALHAAVSNTSSVPEHEFVKDAPILGYQITSDRFEDIPEAIRVHLGAVDQTKYTPEYLKENMGSFIALQMKDGKTPDFYLVGLAAKQAKYVDSSLADVAAKNAKLFTQVKSVPGLSDLMASDPKVIGLLKTAPVSMVKMSDVGYPVQDAVTIESPWGTQTKPAGVDAFLTKNEKAQWYLINTDDKGLPIQYVQKRSGS